MPPRWLALSFVAFWIAMTGLFLWRDVLSRLNPTEPLMFPVELVDEAGSMRNQNLYEVGWWVYRNNFEEKDEKEKKAVYAANLEWIYVPESDTFDSHCRLWHSEALPVEKQRLLPILNLDMESHYSLTRRGQMHSFSVTSAYSCELTGKEKEKGSIRPRATVEGTPDARRLVPNIKISSARKEDAELLRPIDESGEAVEVGERNMVLNPLHPVRRFPALQPGQHWTVTLIDPFAIGALAHCAYGTLTQLPEQEKLPKIDLLTAPAAYVLEARVEREQEILPWEGKEIPCRIIRIGEDNPMLSMTIWVAVSDGTSTRPEGRETLGAGSLTITPVGEGHIVKQEVSLMGDSWVMVRRLHAQHFIPTKFTPKLP